MNFRIERVAFSVAVIAIAVAGVAGWMYFEQRAAAQPVQVSQQSTESLLQANHDALYNTPARSHPGAILRAM